MGLFVVLARSTPMFFDNELYEKACLALYRRCQRRGWICNQPNRSETEFTKTLIILKNVKGELGRYDIQKQRLIPEVG